MCSPLHSVDKTPRPTILHRNVCVILRLRQIVVTAPEVGCYLP